MMRLYPKPALWALWKGLPLVVSRQRATKLNWGPDGVPPLRVRAAYLARHIWLTLTHSPRELLSVLEVR